MDHSSNPNIDYPYIHHIDTSPQQIKKSRDYVYWKFKYEILSMEKLIVTKLIGVK